MNEQIESILKPLRDLMSADISRDDTLGTENGFHEVNKVKNSSGEKIVALLEDLNGVVDVLPTKYAERELGKVRKLLSELQDFATQIEQCVKRRTEDPNFHHQRKRIHEHAVSFDSSFEEKLLDLEVAILSAKAIQVGKSAELTEKVAELEVLIKQARERHKEVEQIAEILRSLSAKTSYAEAQSSYGSLAQNHACREWWWFWATVVAAVLLGAAVVYILTLEYQVTEAAQAILIVLQKAILLSVPFVLLRVTLTKYNAERHLRILYDHRNAAIDQLQLMEAAIAKNEQAKADLRIAAARMILSDPESGYMRSGDGAEVNISPVFGALEKLSGKT